MSLNKEQQLAAQHKDGPCLVLAGPGTGKTHTMIARTHYLIKDGVKPDKVIVMTFTKKAANEIKERLTRIDKAYEFVKAGTFHSVAIDIIRRYGKMPSLSIIDDDEESAELIRYVADRLKVQSPDSLIPKKILHAAYKMRPHKDGSHNYGYDKKIFEEYNEGFPFEIDPIRCDNTTASFLKDVENMVEEGLAPDFLGDSPERVLVLLFKGFERKKKSLGILSFDDCITVGTEILQGSSGDSIREQIEFISVDEFQDSNADQIEFVNELCSHNNNIFVVGDDKQSIYCWRGAYPKVFDDFRERYNPREVNLIQNYRSTANVINFVNSVAKDRPKDSPLLTTEQKTGASPILIEVDSGSIPDLDDSVGVQAQKIFDIVKNTRDYKNTAVLFRSHMFGVSISLQRMFMEARIPFKLVGGMGFMDTRVFKRCKDVMRILENPSWAMPWINILGMFPGIGDGAATLLAKNIGFADNFQEALSTLGKSKHELSKKAQLGHEEAMSFLYPLRNMSKSSKSMDVANAVMTEIAYLVNGWSIKEVDRSQDWKMFIKNSNPEGVSMPANVLQAIHEICERHSTVSAWLDAVNVDDSPTDEEKNEVTLSTVHGAKGKEWDHVFIPELKKGQFPNSKIAQFNDDSLGETIQFNEERNIFYVAVSRAKKNLYLLGPKNKLSPFLANLKNHGCVNEFGYPVTMPIESDHFEQFDKTNEQPSFRVRA